MNDPSVSATGEPEAYVALALAQHPSLEADYDRWRAGVASIARSRRIPDPTVTYAYFVRPVETRVGPQRHRLSITQSFPWPTQLRAGADAAALRARALERRFDARVLQVRAAVEERYWRLWYVRRVQAVHAAQLALLDALADVIRGRVEASTASFADLMQADVSRVRMRDQIDGLQEQERGAEAELRQAIGAPFGTPTPTSAAPPQPALPREDMAALLAALRDHPDLQAFDALADAFDSDARRATAEGLPMLQVGLDWTETGGAVNPVAGSGTDSVVVRVGASVPLQRRSYREAREAASASADATRSDRRAAEDIASAQLEATLAALRDTHRRVLLHRRTLAAQARAAYEAVLGAYQAGRASVAATLLAQRDLLELEQTMLEADAGHARAWARLEAIVGRHVPRSPSEDDREGSVAP
ncbi:MAG: TolC family protein [Polyangiales bacterium]|nr:TolC family protein [Myxococcales bacterium]